MPDLYRFSPVFLPILIEGMTARLFGSQLPPEGKNVRCVGVGALPEYQKDFGSLTAATWSSDTADTNLDMSTMELGQYRMRVQDDLRVRLLNPAGVQQWRSKDNRFYLPQFPVTDGEDFLKTFYFAASEFFVFENNAGPAFSLYSTLTATVSRVLFNGWKMKLSPIAERGRIDIWIDSWPSQSQATV